MRRAGSLTGVESPCRVTLRDGAPRDTLLLTNFEQLPVATPYRSRHAISIRENTAEAQVNETSQVLHARLISLRAFDHPAYGRCGCHARHRAKVATERMQEQVAYLHASYATMGCFAARVDRVQVRLVARF